MNDLDFVPNPDGEDGGGLGHVLRVNEDHTFHVIDPNDYHPIAAKILDGTEGVMG